MDNPAFQVIVLGPTGGPKEDAITGLLVRSTATNWSKGSVAAVDAGTLLSGIVRILDQNLTIEKDGKAAVHDGPFVGLEPPHKTAQANAAYIFREVIVSVLITHPHLDHLSGLAINTPIVEASSGPKTVAGLPSAIAAMKNHMFNDIIWPNLSDEDGGAGLITYQRLVEGGNPRFGRGESRGYVRACDGLVTKCLSVSHGRCKQQFHDETGRHHRIGSAVFASDPMMMSSARALSIDQADGGIYSPVRSPHLGSSLSNTPGKDNSNWGVVESSAFFIRDEKTGKEIIIFGDIEPDSVSLEPRNKRVWEIAAPKIAAGSLRAIFIECSFNDAVDDETLYGHLCPRHLIAELKRLAAKVAEAKAPLQDQGRENHQQQQRRRGRSSKRKRKDSDTAEYARDHGISPRSTRYPITRLVKPEDSNETSPVSEQASASTHTLGEGKACDDIPMMTEQQYQTENGNRNGNRNGNENGNGTNQVCKGDSIYVDGNNSHSYEDNNNNNTAEDEFAHPTMQWTCPEGEPPLAGFKVYIIHIKDTLTDGPHPSERILEELRAQSSQAGLGCEFHVPFQGEGIWI